MAEEKSEKEQIANLLHVCYFLSEAIYAHLYGEMSDEDIKECVDKIAADEDFKNYLYHRYVLKDTWSNPFINQFTEDTETTTIDDDPDGLKIN